MLRILTLATLFPDASRPNFGVFVERQTIGIAAHADVELKVVAPIGLPLWPLSHHSRFRTLKALPERETWKGLDVRRPRFATVPGTGGRWHVAALTRRLIPLLTELRRDFAFDVIDAEFFFPDGPAAIALGRHFGVPVSIKARGGDIHYWGESSARVGQIREAGQQASGLLAVSQALRDDMMAMGMPSEKIRVHHTGVDFDRFAPVDRVAAKLALGIEGPLILSVGALIPIKGHDIVLGAMQELGTGTLLIAGAGPEKQRLEEEIERRGLTGRARLLGAVPHAEVPGLIAAADVMALASSSEGLANAWVEALACGTPIVIPDVGGAREVVTAPVHGRLVDRTPQAFAAAIRELIANPPAQQDVRAGAVSFTWPANTEALYAHLAGMVGGRG